MILQVFLNLLRRQINPDQYKYCGYSTLRCGIEGANIARITASLIYQ